jgi:SAM-dependent methyltransferase
VSAGTSDNGHLRGRSERLRGFVDEMPLERDAIARFTALAAASMRPGSRVADVGAGDAPYRELFDHVDYVTIDWGESLHQPPGGLDITAQAHALPVDDCSFDGVILTQVLEHVPNPSEVLGELFRILVPGGRLFAAVPLLWEEHEAPHDYFRYTRFGLARLLTDAGFEAVEVQPRTDCFTALSQLALNARWAMGSAPDGLDEERSRVADRLTEIADELTAFAHLDANRSLTLGFTAIAVKPDSP